VDERVTNHAALASRIAGDGASSDASIAEAVARALGKLAQRESEPVVMKLIEHEANEVRVAAAQALAAFGTVAAVEPLLAQTSGVLKDATLKRAALQAISSIQSRLGPVEMGRLSLLEPAPLEGALSIAEEATGAGALSMADEPLAELEERSVLKR
jgi:HEAT repeat protein